MKVLQINCVYKTGSTGKIVNDIHNVLLKNEIESVVCYGRGEMINEPFVYKTSTELEAKLNNLKSRVGGLQYGGCIIATHKLLSIIKKEKPDVVHLHCINGFFVNIYKLVEFLKKNNIPTVLTLHAEFIHTGSCGHAYECNRWKTGCGKCPNLKKATLSYLFDRTAKSWRKMKSAFEGFNNIEIVSVSPWLEGRAKQSPILSDFKHLTVLNGVDCDTFKLHKADDLRKKHGLDGKYVIVHVTANFNSKEKGGQYIKELAKRLGDDAVIVVIGSRERSADLPGNIIDIGRVENQTELARYYSIADLSVITSKKETFSMPVAESLCCGTPVAGFMSGGPESIAIAEYSDFAEYGDVDGLERLIKNRMKKKTDKTEIASQAKEKYSKQRMTAEYMNIYRNLLNTEGHE